MNENAPTYALGAKINSNDNRDVHLATVLAPVILPFKVITDISVLPIENQMAHGSCVGQAEGKGAEWREYLELGKVVEVSKRFIYARCKQLDGDPNQGTYPRIAASVLSNDGVPKRELIPDTNDIPYEQYIAISVNDEIKTDASARRVKGYAFCYTLHDVKQAIAQKGVLNITVLVGQFGTSPVKPQPAQGAHRVLVYGYEDANNNTKDDTKIYFRNSWGSSWDVEGDGWFWWSEFENSIYDMMVYTDMPNTIIDYVKKQQYKFTRVLHIGMSGTDVNELQKRLAKEIASDGVPCYQYGIFTTYFGPLTEKAVKRYQEAKGIISYGTYKTTGYGQIGPKTMKMLNLGITPPPTSKIEAWADATQQHEGWFPGSRSYRNNNPGNIKYVGQPSAIGSDSLGFCIFATYADGRKSLTDMLIRAATPPAEGYNPEMTLVQFYERYAPSSDNNNPLAYAQFVARKIGVTVDTQIKNLV